LNKLLHNLAQNLNTLQQNLPTFHKGRREKEEQEHHHKRKEAQKIIRNKKKMYMKNVTESIEEDQKHNNTRKIYQTLNQFKKGYQHKLSIIRNEKEKWQ
jgi:hypothetical protein